MNVNAVITGSVAGGAALGLGAVALARAKDEPGSNAADALLDFAPTTSAWAAANIGVIGGVAMLAAASPGVRIGGAAVLTLGVAGYAAFAASLLTGGS